MSVMSQVATETPEERHERRVKHFLELDRAKEEAKQRRQGERPALVFHRGDEIVSLPTPRQLVYGRVVESSMGFTVSESGVGKTFLLANLGLAIACGLEEWCGAPIPKDLRGRSVVYALAEGVGRFKYRLLACLQEWHEKGLINDPDTIPESFVLTGQRLGLKDDKGVNELIAQVKDVQAVMTFVDTWQRHGGTEVFEEMNDAIGRLDRIREETGSAVQVAHHTPKDGRLTPRGPGSLDASADTVILLRPEEDVVLARFEQRDLEPSTMAFRLKLVTLNRHADEQGRPITSLVVDPTNAATAKKVAAKTAKAVLKDDARIQQLYKYVEDHPGCSVADVKNYLVAGSAWISRTIADLVAAGNLRREETPGQGSVKKVELFARVSPY
jgi:hypothetical protein